MRGREHGATADERAGAVALLARDDADLGVLVVPEVLHRVEVLVGEHALGVATAAQVHPHAGEAVGQVGHPDAYTAIQNALQFYKVDEILISTFEGERSGWLRANLIERVEATVPSPILGDMAVTVSYADYRDFGGVKFPTKIRQTYGGFPTWFAPNGFSDIKSAS